MKTQTTPFQPKPLNKKHIFNILGCSNRLGSKVGKVGYNLPQQKTTIYK